MAAAAAAAAAAATADADAADSADDGLFDDWAFNSKQGHMLTGGGVAASGYAAFGPEELPHAALRAGEWLEKAWGRAVARGNHVSAAGAWARSMFAGGVHADFTTRVFDLQTPGGAFVDVRVPPTRPDGALARCGSLANATLEELRVLSRQHAFAGVTQLDGEVATRLHVADWNPPPRRTPNRFNVEMRSDATAWTEVCAAVDARGYTAYIERWEALPGGQGAGFLAAHRTRTHGAAPGGGREALLVVAGSHFARAVARQRPLPHFEDAAATPSLADLVDAAYAAGDADEMRKLLDMDAAYGTLSDARGWHVALATMPWREGSSLWGTGARAELLDGGKRFRITSGDEAGNGEWTVLEDSLGEGGLARLLRLVGPPASAAGKDEL